MPSINKNKRKRTPVNITSILEETAADIVTENTRSIFSDNVIAMDADSLLKLDDKATEFIERDKIYPNPINAPYMEDITENDFDALRFSLLDVGLMHNLVVLDDGMGRYRLISGEKRWTAFSRMPKEEYDKNFPNGIECKILPYNPELTETDEHIMLLTCNVLTFSSGSPDPRQLRDLIGLYIKKGYQKKELVEYLSFYLAGSSQTIYKLIAESQAIDELYELYKNNVLTRAALQCLGNLPVEDQKAIYKKIIDEDIKKIDQELALNLKKNVKEKKKKGAAAKSEGSISFMKYDKSLDTASTYLDKILKIKLDGMNELELSLAKAKLEILNRKIKEFSESIDEAIKTQEKL